VVKSARGISPVTYYLGYLSKKRELVKKKIYPPKGFFAGVDEMGKYLLTMLSEILSKPKSIPR
jgi:hypothetical protein